MWFSYFTLSIIPKKNSTVVHLDSHFSTSFSLDVVFSFGNRRRGSARPRRNSFICERNVEGQRWRCDEPIMIHSSTKDIYIYIYFRVPTQPSDVLVLVCFVSQSFIGFSVLKVGFQCTPCFPRVFSEKKPAAEVLPSRRKGHQGHQGPAGQLSNYSWKFASYYSIPFKLE